MAGRPFPRDAGLQRFRTGLCRVPDAELAGEGAGPEQIVDLFAVKIHGGGLCERAALADGGVTAAVNGL